MSERIRQTIEVLTLIRDEYTPVGNVGKIKQLRNRAEYKISNEHNVSFQSIQSKYITQMMPSVQDAHHFDVLTFEWLENGATELRDILSSYSYDSVDPQLVESFFPESTFEDTQILTEFDHESYDRVYKEGKMAYRIHLIKERNRTLVRNAKRTWMSNSGGDILCYVCGFSFLKKYGNDGAGFIEAHHDIPLSQVSGEVSITIDDLKPVCSNCHRILHLKRLTITCDELRTSLKSRSA